MIKGLKVKGCDIFIKPLLDAFTYDIILGLVILFMIQMQSFIVTIILVVKYCMVLYFLNGAVILFVVIVLC